MKKGPQLCLGSFLERKNRPLQTAITTKQALLRTQKPVQEDLKVQVIQGGAAFNQDVQIIGSSCDL